MPTIERSRFLEAAHQECMFLLTRRLQDRIAETIQEGTFSTPEAVAMTLAERLLEPEYVDRLGAEIVRIFLALRRSPFIADGETINFGDALQGLSHRRHTGVMVIRSPDTIVDLYLEDGHIAFINPRRARLDNKFGVNIYCQGQAVSADYIQHHLEVPVPEGDSLFFHLIEDGILDRDDFASAMTNVGINVLCEALVEQGRCSFEYEHRDGLPELFAPHDLKFPVQKFLIYLYSSLDEWKRYRAEVLDRNVTYNVSRNLDRDTLEALGPEQAQVLEAIDGRRSVTEIADACRLNLLDLCRRLSMLINVGLVCDASPDDTAILIGAGADPAAVRTRAEDAPEELLELNGALGSSAASSSTP